MPLISGVTILKKAYEGKYAIAQINTNNLEWTKAILLTAEECKSPVIVGASEGAIKYMGGFNVVFNLVKSMILDLNITVPIILHLDHGSFNGCKKAMEVGFTSVMFDGSSMSIDENIEKSKIIIDLAKKNNVSVELEIGTIGGEEDGIVGIGEEADLNECIAISKLKPTTLAAGIGNVHGEYPENWTGLNFELLESISKSLKIPMVLHGGTGIQIPQIKKSISLGISKININSELQMCFAKKTRQYIEEKKDLDNHNKGFDPRKLLNYGFEGIKEVIKNKFEIFGSVNKA